jgi:ferric-dicitrate binding protein FerR (iron transport regulator)
MNKQMERYPMTDPEHIETDDGQLASLFDRAQARPRPPGDAEARVRRAIEAEWQAMTHNRQTRRRYFALGIAATVALATVLGVWLLGQPAPLAPPASMASVSRITGTAVIDADEGVVLTAGSPVRSGQTVATGPDSRLGLDWVGGASIRLDENSRIQLISSSRVRLAHGRLYVDIDPAATKDIDLDVLTARGTLRHLGTQYMAEWTGSTLVLSVREGAVEVANPARQDAERADAGDRLRLAAGQPAVRGRISAHDEAWAWAEALAPEFELEGRSMHDFLRWVGRETGRSVEYMDSDAERSAKDTILHGEVDLEPGQALQLILRTSDLVSEESADRILIRLGG